MMRRIFIYTFSLGISLSCPCRRIRLSTLSRGIPTLSILVYFVMVFIFVTSGLDMINFTSPSINTYIHYGDVSDINATNSIDLV